LTCNISVKPALESKSVIAKLKQLRAVALVADYTLYPPSVTEELARFDRTGVPLVLVYPQDAAKPPIILPDPLPYPAPYSPVVLAALNKASE
jgi:thiol:disulfide interchange protein DsbD